MKKGKVIGIFLVSFLLTMTPIVQAAGIDDLNTQGKKVSIDSALSITKYEDGRVAPVQNVDKLTEKQVHDILSQMNVTDDEIKTFPDKFKRKLISRGGVKVKVNTEGQQYYNSLSGKRYQVTDENKDEIDLIKQQDIETLNPTPKDINKGEVQTLGMGSYTSSGGKFIGGAKVFYLGKTSNGVEYIYDYYTTYDWYALQIMEVD